MTTFQPQEVEIDVIFAARTAVSEIRADFSKFPFWGMKPEIKKFQRLHMDSLSTPGVEIEIIFILRAAVSQIEPFGFYLG